MYQASAAFHEAVKNNEHQIALLIFKDAVFTNSDIDVNNGIEFHEYFNLEEDISIGQTLSNEISFTLFNDDGNLNNYAFGEFTAMIGVRVGSSAYIEQGTAYLSTKYATYVGNASYPYLTRNGVPVSAQPSFPVKSIVAYGDKVYVFSGTGKSAVYDDTTGANITSEGNADPSMRNRAHDWEGMGYYLNQDTRIMFAYGDGRKDRYEFVPLGKFSAVRPNVPDQIYIDFTCNDFMTKFDISMPSADDLKIKYPITLKKLLKACCDYVKVTNGESAGNFINSGLEIAEEPGDFKNATMRTVIGWIAEAAGANACFDRDGKFRLKWLTTTGQSYDEHDYTDFQPYWYKVPTVDRVLNRDTQNAADDVEGSGKNGYLIQDNPFLRVESKEPEDDEDAPWNKARNWDPIG